MEQEEIKKNESWGNELYLISNNDMYYLIPTTSIWVKNDQRWAVVMPTFGIPVFPLLIDTDMAEAFINGNTHIKTLLKREDGYFVKLKMS